MNEDFIKIIKKKNDILYNYLTENINERPIDTLFRNYFIGNRNRFLNQLNESIKQNFIDANSYDLILEQFDENFKSKIAECQTLNGNFSFKPSYDLDTFAIHSENHLENLSIEEFLKYQNKKNANKTCPKASDQKIDFNLFDKTSNYVQNYESKPLNQSNGQKPTKPASFGCTLSTVDNASSFNRPATTVNNDLFEPNRAATTVTNSVSSEFSQSAPLYNKPQSFKPNIFAANSNLASPKSNNSTNTSNSLSNNDSNPNGNNVNKFTGLKYEPRYTKCYKRRNEDEMEENKPESNEVAKSNPFKSASEQLMIENANKGQSHQQQQQQQNNYQSLAKRPMNNLPNQRRNVHSKFNLPIRTNEEDTTASNNNSRNASNNNANSNQNNLTADNPNLKNIDQKLIEIISSEVMDRTPPITWDDIAGLEFVKKTIKEIVIWPMLRPDIFHGLRGPPKGLLLFGPPGTGKTLIAKCIANESKSTFFNISSSTLTSKWQGESEKLVKVLFEVARSYQPSVIFIDEIDSLLSQRSDEDRESSRRLKTEFFVQMDGAQTNGDERILLIGATNRPQELDDAARRRFVKRLYIPLPEHIGRRQIVMNLMRKQHNELTNEEMDEIAELTDGYSGADMTNLCREAALGPIRSLETVSIVTISEDQVRPVNCQDFLDAMQQVRASVSSDDLDAYVKWNNTFGSVAIQK